ncbi:MAG: NAD-dependent deacylase, partial [Anaerolineaceae bacterium]|nr:NAD-dependent deacylase [Anaerolineaceae bacterium]
MNPKDHDLEQITLAQQIIKSSKNLICFTGAGISTPSGIPDFRTPGSGEWTKTDPMKVASLTAFKYRPQQFFTWLKPLVKNSLAAKPNPAHSSLAALEELGVLKCVVTQNIDGLHQLAGSKNVIELHGTLHTLSCLRCGNQFATKDILLPVLESDALPICPNCKAILKPDIVLFEEALPNDAWNTAQDYFESSDAIIICGSSLEVYPAALLPL